MPAILVEGGFLTNPTEAPVPGRSRRAPAHRRGGRPRHRGVLGAGRLGAPAPGADPRPLEEQARRRAPGYRLVKPGLGNPVGRGGWLAVIVGFRRRPRRPSRPRSARGNAPAEDAGRLPAGEDRPEQPGRQGRLARGLSTAAPPAAAGPARPVVSAGMAPPRRPARRAAAPAPSAPHPRARPTGRPRPGRARGVPAARHADWEPAAGRRDPVDVLEEQAATRVPELVPIRYGRMLTSPFAFYRGAAALMAADLADTPNTGVRVQLCGDAHLSNFGFFASPERALVFSVNDFDETLPGPWEWDVKRFAASFAIAARAGGFDAEQERALLLRTVASYRSAMRDFAAMRDLEVWYARPTSGRSRGG